MKTARFRLTWLSRVRTANDMVALFVDAKTGEEVWRYTLIQRQSAVGTGTGVLGDRKKLSTRQASSVFLADDALRPPTLITYDLKGNYQRVFDILDGVINPAQSDVATDSDNTWTDGANVDAHAYVGFTYDFYFQRFGRRGLDGNNRAIRSIVHPAPREDPLSLPPVVLDNFLLNAFWCGDCGQPGPGLHGVRRGPPDALLAGRAELQLLRRRLRRRRARALARGHRVHVGPDLPERVRRAERVVLGHHGHRAEFYVRSTGRSDRAADYLIGEDIVTPARPGALTGIRSMSDPRSFGDPDHYSIRYTGPEDNGGVHINSGISNHAFFLAIEGGTNRTSGLAVTGVGGGNREQIERIFYRGFTSYLTPNATFAQARQATLRAASELFGDSSPAFRAVQQAWTAVGVN